MIIVFLYIFPIHQNIVMYGDNSLKTQEALGDYMVEDSCCWSQEEVFHPVKSFMGLEDCQLGGCWVEWNLVETIAHVQLTGDGGPF